MTTKLRLAKQDDINNVLIFMAEYYKTEGIKFNKIKSKRTLEDFISKANHGSLWIILSNYKPIGYFCIVYSYTLENYGKDCFLDEFYIKPESRNKGIGTEVMKFIETYLTKNDFKAIHLVVYNKNLPAYKYYLKNGFVSQKAKFMTRKLVYDNQI